LSAWKSSDDYRRYAEAVAGWQREDIERHNARIDAEWRRIGTGDKP
jgi:hypothetical protein